MPDAVGLVKIVKKSAVEAVEAGKPVTVITGKVTGVTPLTITIDQKLVLGAAQLLLTRNVTDFELAMTVDHQTEPAGGRSHSHKVTTTKDSGSTDTDVAPNHVHKYKGKKTFLVHNALQEGETVLLIRQQGGQKYLVLDRVGVMG